MFNSILKAFKNIFGFRSNGTESRKRPHQDDRVASDFPDDISTDEDVDFESINSAKRQKVDINENSEMALGWVRAQKGFSNSFQYVPIEKPQSEKISHQKEFGSGRLKTKLNATVPREFINDKLNNRWKFKGPPERDNEKRSINHEESIENNPTLESNLKPSTGNSYRDISETPVLNGAHHSKHAHYHNHREPIYRPHSILSETNTFSRLTVSRCSQMQEKEKYRQLLNRFPQPSTIMNGPENSLSLRHSASRRNMSSPSAKNSFSKVKLSALDQKQQAQSILNSSSGHSNGLQKRNLMNVKAFQTPSNGDLNLPVRAKSRHQLTQNGKLTSTKPSSEVSKWKLKSDELNCPYTNKKWLEEWKNKLHNQEKEKKKQIEEAKRRIEATRPPWEKEFRELEKNIKDQLLIAEKQSEVLEEIYTSKDDVSGIEDEELEPLPELTPEMDKQIDSALRPKPPNEILVDKFQIPIHRRDMETLQDLNWLNDAVINFYMNLLMERGKMKNMPSVYACNTFFYTKLISGGHSALKRWTRRTDIFSYDIMLVPVHLGAHWCLAVVDFRKKKIKYYDSMGGKNNECLNALANYLQEESLDKKKQSLCMDDWSLECVKDAPQQMNSSDCGMFACKYAEYITRNVKITFKQHHMPYFRRRMVYEILSARLL